MAGASHILIVDDEPRICRVVQEYLRQEGYRVSAAGHSEAMFRILDEAPVDLVILDLVLPGRDGLTLTRLLRERSDIGIIILTGKGEMVDRVVGLEIGADDYVTKPFELRELLARVRSVLRRKNGTPADTSHDATTLQFANWRFDPLARELISPWGVAVPLTTGEFNLLSAFVKNPNRVLTRDQLSEHVGARRWDPLDRSIDVLIGRLRRKLEEDPARPQLIKTVRGAGYVFTPKVQAG